MKNLIMICLLCLSACNQSSSPDGRSRLRDEEIHKEIEALKTQQNTILDSIRSLDKQLKALKQNKK
jgi:septal ring factor EnvC (AmiA/AmiB activator)